MNPTQRYVYALSWIRHNGFSIWIGVVLRFIVWYVRSSYTNINTYQYVAFTTFHSHSNEAIEECYQMIANQWPLYHDVCDSTLNSSIIIHIGQLSSTLTSMGKICFGILLQVIVSYLITCYSDNKNEKTSLSIALFYWWNPFVIFQSSISIFGCAFDFLIVCTLLAIKKEKYTCASVLLALFISWDFKFMCLLPTFFTSSLNMSFGASLFWSIGSFALYLLYEKYRGEPELILESKHEIYFPSIGVYWYLNGQVFNNFTAYCRTLLSAQPLIYAFPLAIRFKDEPPDISVCVVSSILLGNY